MLNQDQQKAVVSDGHCLITACPGSGKTTVLVHRAVHLLKKHPQARLVGVTFTSDAANSLKRRILDEIPDAENRVLCGTFHGICKKQVERSSGKLVLVDESEQNRLVQRAWRIANASKLDEGEKLVYNAEEVKAFIDGIKCQAEPILPSRDIEPLVDVYMQYQNLLRELGTNDFADLIVKCVKGMVSGEVAPLDCDYILADEFQDTDGIQLAWIMAHVRNGALVTVVGDDDQAIYSWRSALGLKAMEQFRDETCASHISLDVTYRCAREIVAPAGRLISYNNNNRVIKDLRTEFKGRGQVRLHGYQTPEQEVDGIVTAIETSGEPHKWAILSRSNKPFDLIESRLKMLNIPYTRSSGFSIWECQAPALLLAICSSIAKNDMRGLDAALRVMRADEAVLGEIRARYEANKPGSLNRALADPAFFKMRGIYAEVGNYFKAWINGIRQGQEENIIELIGAFVQKTGAKLDRSRSKDEIKVDTLRLNTCVSYMKSLRGSLRQRLLVIRNQDNDAKKPKETEVEKIAAGVSLLTMHSSKGLEFENVWIIGCNEDITPPKKSTNIEEERRLFYVAMTRAKINLFLSYYKFANSKDADAAAMNKELDAKLKLKPSRFLTEAEIL